MLECLAQASGSDKKNQERAGQGYEDGDAEEDEEEDGFCDDEKVEEPKRKSRGERKRDTMGEVVASTVRSSSRACMPDVRPTEQSTCAVQELGERRSFVSLRKDGVPFRSEDRPGVEAITRNGGRR